MKTNKKSCDYKTEIKSTKWWQQISPGKEGGHFISKCSLGMTHRSSIKNIIQNVLIFEKTCLIKSREIVEYILSLYSVEEV